MSQDIPAKRAVSASGVTKESHAPATLKAIFDAAFFETYLDKDGDLFVKNDYRILIKSNPMFVQMIAMFGVQKGASRLALLESVNRMSLDLNVPRAYLATEGQETMIVFDYTVTIGEVLPPRVLIESFRFFEKCLRTAANFFDGYMK